MKFYFEKRALVGFTCTIFALVLLVIFSFSSTQRLIQTSALYAHRLSVFNNSDLVLNNILDLESGYRGYVITGDTIFMAAVLTDTKALELCMRRLDSLTSTDAFQTKIIDSLYHFIAKKQEWSQGIIAARQQDFESPQALIASGKGRIITNSVRESVARLKQREDENYQRHNTIKGSSLREFQISFIGLTLVSALTILYLFYVINKT